MNPYQRAAIITVSALSPIAGVALAIGRGVTHWPSFVSGFLFAVLVAEIAVLAWMELTGRTTRRAR